MRKKTEDQGVMVTLFVGSDGLGIPLTPEQLAQVNEKFRLWKFGRSAWLYQQMYAEIARAADDSSTYVSLSSWKRHEGKEDNPSDYSGNLA